MKMNEWIKEGKKEGRKFSYIDITFYTSIKILAIGIHKRNKLAKKLTQIKCSKYQDGCQEGLNLAILTKCRLHGS